MADEFETEENLEFEADSLEPETLEDNQADFSEDELLEKFEAAGDDNGDDGELKASGDVSEESQEASPEYELEGTELEGFESAEIEEEEFLEEDTIVSIVESVLFATDKPVSLASIKQSFKGTQVRTNHIRRAIDSLAVEYAGGRRGITIEEVSGGYQIRTKMDNLRYVRQMVKSRPFKLSGPALEVLAIIAYKQPMIKAHVDEIRGVESGHLLRALMEKGIVSFAGKSDLPGKPMFYQTTRKFLEIFGLRNLKELPSLSEIDELIPEGIGEEVEEKQSLSDVTDEMSEEIGSSYSQGEEELMKISSELEGITTSSDFFEQEKARIKAKKESERAEDIRDALAVGEAVESKDVKWLERYEAKLAEEAAAKEAALAAETAGETAAVEGEIPPEESLEALSEEVEEIKEAEASSEDRVGALLTDLDQAMAQFDDETDEEAGEASELYNQDLSVFEEAEEIEPDPSTEK